MINKVASFTDVVPLGADHKEKGFIRLASGRMAIEPNSEKARIVEAEIKKHPNALFFRAKAIVADEANSNGDYFSEEEILKSYKTFEGVPFFTNHDNQNVENAKGKVIFAEWVPEEKAVYTISFIDRDAYPHICRSIEEEYIQGVSMGAQVEYSECNICGNIAHDTDDYCTHVKNFKSRKFTGTAKHVVTGEIKKFSNHPVFEKNYGLKYIELSAVVDPACTSCKIDTIIDNNTYLRKVANIQNNLFLFKTSSLQKIASQQEVDEIEQVLGILEKISINLIQNRKQVEMEFASDLVKILSDLQDWADELVAAGYGKLNPGEPQGQIPGIAPDGNAGVAPAPSPGVQDESVPVISPVSSEQEFSVGQETEDVGKISGSPSKPLTSAPKLPISAPLRPRARDIGSLIVTASGICNKISKTGEDEMAKRRTKDVVSSNKSNTIETLSNSWKEKTSFLEYIKRVPEIQNNENKISVKMTDDSFIILAGKNNKNNNMVWAYDDLSDEDKKMIIASPVEASKKFLKTFENKYKLNKEGEIKMANSIKQAGAETVNHAPETITEDQLENSKNLYHGRTHDEINSITQKQLDSEREGEQNVITEAQMEAKRTNNTPSTITEDQLGGGARKENAPNSITQDQLDAKRVGNEKIYTTERQLDDTDKPWARFAGRNPAKFKTASEHMDCVVASLADVAISSGGTANEVAAVAASLVDSTKNRVDLMSSIVSEREDNEEDIDFAKRASFWNNKNLKVATAGKREIADMIVKKLRAIASNETINPEIILDAIEVVGESENGVESISDCITEKLKEVNKESVVASRKNELRTALSKNSKKSDLAARENERKEIMEKIAKKNVKKASEAVVNEEVSFDKSEIGNADTIIETSFDEMGIKKDILAKNEGLFRKNIVTFARGALAGQNIKLAAITNVTVDENGTIQIAVQTGDEKNDVEIPLDQDLPLDESEMLPEGDVSGEGLGNLDQGAAPAPAPAPASGLGGAPQGYGAMASSKKRMTKVAQSPMGGGMPGTPGGVSAPGAPEQGLPGATPDSDPVQALTMGDDAGVAEDIPTVGEKQMPWTICPECGSADCDVTSSEEGNISGTCNSCGCKYDALVKKEVEFVIKNPDKSDAETPEAPEVPALPVAASINLNKKSIVRIAANLEKHGLVCPSCGNTHCASSVDQDGHTEYSCGQCGTDVVKDVFVSVQNPDEGKIQVEWAVSPDTDCSGCSESVSKFASRVKVAKLIKEASKKEFPTANCVERLARMYGGDAVGSFGPCKGKMLAECVCSQLKKFALTKVKHLKKLASVSMQEDPWDTCMKEQEQEHNDKEIAESICGCLKEKYASTHSNNIFVQAFSKDLGEKDLGSLTMEDLVAMGEIANEDNVVASASVPLDEEDIGDEIVMKPEDTVLASNGKKEKKIMANELRKEASQLKRVKDIEGNVDAGVPRSKATMGNESSDNIDVAYAPRNVPSGSAAASNEQNIALTKKEKAGPDVPVDSSYMGDEKRIQNGMPPINNEIKGTVIAKKMEQVDTIEGQVDVPRSKKNIGGESAENIDVPEAKLDVPRSGSAASANEKNIAITKDEASGPDVPIDGKGFLGHEEEAAGGDKETNDQYLTNYHTAGKRNERMERIAQARRMKAVETASYLVATKRIASDKETYSAVVDALSSIAVDKIDQIADRMFPEQVVKTASTQERRQVTAETGHSIPAIVIDAGSSISETSSLADKIASMFTIGNKGLNDNLEKYNER